MNSQIEKFKWFAIAKHSFTRKFQLCNVRHQCRQWLTNSSHIRNVMKPVSLAELV